MGYAGGCRRDELTKMSTDDIEYKTDTIIVTVPKTESNIPRLFVITESHWIALIRKYVRMRPAATATKRFFLTYRNGRCVNSPIGINKISQVPRVIAGFLNLPEPDKYTGHCFRRSSASQGAHGGELITIKRAGGWKSSSEVAEVLRAATGPQPGTSDGVQHFISVFDNMPENLSDSDSEPEVPSQEKQCLLPKKSKELYEETYNAYKRWCVATKITKTTEDSVLSYFNNHLASYKSSTLWSKYSMLRATINQSEQVDISKFHAVMSLLRSKSDGYKPKKSLILTREHVDRFLTQAEDKHHLLNKVILIFGISGACTRQELASLLTHHVQDHQTHFLIKLHDFKTQSERSFFILSGQLKNLDLLDIIRSYIRLRSPKTSHDRFFVSYLKEKCTVQPVGVHKIASVPAIVAKFNNLENHAMYTGHCFRRTAAALTGSGAQHWSV